MKKVELKDLTVDKTLENYLCHVSGEILHRPGETLTLSHLTIMEECRIENVILLDTNEDPESFKQEVQQKSVAVEDITPGEECPVTLFDVGKTVVIEEGVIIQQETLAELHSKEVTELYYHKDRQELLGFQYEKYTTLLESDTFASIGDITVLEHPGEKALREEEKKKQREEEKKGPGPFDFQNLIIHRSLFFLNPSKDISTANLKQAMKSKAKMRRTLQPPPYKNAVKLFAGERDEKVKRIFIERYHGWIGKLQEIFARLKVNHPIQFEEVDRMAKDMIASYAEDGCFHLNLANMRLSRVVELYILSHSVNVCLLSIGMASAYGYGPQQVLEIAIGALLHDIGHVTTYRPLFAKEKLDASEQQKFDQHAILGVSLLKNINCIPKTTAYIIYQHHEKIDGSGRILHCTADTIHDFAKIVAVADMFDILAGDTTPCKAMSTIIKMGTSQLFDMVVLKAALVSLSVFPIGSLVLLTGNKVGKVIATNGNNYKQPMVRTLCRMEVGQMFELDIIENIDLATRKDICIIKEVTNPFLGKNISKGF